MPKLFSYVVDHDLGLAPNPFGGFCTLAKCKFRTAKRRNILEIAEEGDWIVGTGGVDPKKSTGNGTLIYAMRVDEKIPFEEYLNGFRGKRIDAENRYFDNGDFALISNHFFYFGRNAIDISEIPKKHLDHALEKKGPRYRCDFSEKFVNNFVGWLEDKFRVGIMVRRAIHSPIRKLRNVYQRFDARSARNEIWSFS